MYLQVPDGASVPVHHNNIFRGLVRRLILPTATAAICVAALLSPQTSFAKKKAPKAKVNLVPYQPSGWSDKIVITNQASATSASATDSQPLMPTDTVYFNFAVLNNSRSKIKSGFSSAIYIDNVLRTTFSTAPPLKGNFYVYAINQSLGSLSAGTHEIRIQVDSGGAIFETSETDNSYTKTFTVTGAPGGPEISAVSNNTPLPFTPIALTVSGFDPNKPVNVSFSASGFATTAAPLRITDDGKLIVAVPALLDPISHQITFGVANIVVIQDNKQGSAFPVTIQSLPTRDSYGTQPGEITRAMLVFQSIALAHRLNELQAFQLLPGNGVDSSNARATLASQLNAVLRAQDDVNKLMANPALVIQGTTADGTPLQFDKDALDLMDRMNGVFLTQTLFPLMNSSVSKAPEVRSKISTDAFASLIDLMKTSKGISDVTQAVTTISDPKTWVDVVEATASAGGVLIDKLPEGVKTKAIGVGSSVLSQAQVVGTVFADEAAFITAWSEGNQAGMQVAIDAMNSIDRSKLYGAVFDLTLDLVGDVNGFQTVSTLGKWVKSMYGLGEATLANADNESAVVASQYPNPLSSSTEGLARVQGHIDGLDGQDSTQLASFDGSEPVTTLDDLEGDYDLYVPLQVPNTTYQNLTLTIFDPITLSAFGSQPINLTGLNIIQPFEVPPVSVTPPSCIYNLSSTGAHTPYGGGSGSVNVTTGSGCAWTAVSNAGFIHITGISATSGNGTVSYSVDPNNTSSVRVGTLTVAGKTFTNTQDGHPLNYDGTYNITYTGFLTCTVPGDPPVTVSQPLSGPRTWTIVNGVVGDNGGLTTGGIDSTGHVNIQDNIPGIGPMVFTGSVDSTGGATGFWTLPLPPCPGGSGSGTWSGHR